jgi:hypothetical protein
MSWGMKWKRWRARTTRINRVPSAPRYDLGHYCRDSNGWPRSWMGLEEHLPPGEQLLTLFRPFLERLASSNLSPKTVQKHVDNMLASGGEFFAQEDSSTAQTFASPTKARRVWQAASHLRLLVRMRRSPPLLLLPTYCRASAAVLVSRWRQVARGNGDHSSPATLFDEQ